MFTPLLLEMEHEVLRTHSGCLGCWIHTFKELETMSPIQFHLPSALDQSKMWNEDFSALQQSQEHPWPLGTLRVPP